MRRKSDYAAAMLGVKDYVRSNRSANWYVHGERAYPNIFVTF